MHKRNKPFNFTVCRACSSFCLNGDEYCGITCKNIYQSSGKKVGPRRRCIACQRRQVEEPNIEICKLCTDAPKCSCGNLVWLDFEEKYSQFCLNCLWGKEINVETSDEYYGRPKRISILVRCGDQVLVHKRGSAISRPGELAVNSGTVDTTDESSFHTAIREMKEEASLDISGYAIYRVSKELYCVELTEDQFINIDETTLKPAAGFEHEVDEWGYHFMRDEDIMNLSGKNTFAKRTLICYGRFMQYTPRMYTNPLLLCVDDILKLHRMAQVLALTCRLSTFPKAC